MTTPPYLLGRLAAALEHLGMLTDRQLALASTATHHLITPLGRATAMGEEARDLLTPIAGQLPPDSLGLTLAAAEQSDYWLGYHHQRAEFRAGRLPRLPEIEPDLGDRWEIRIEPDLKSWALDNGGSKLVRALLRAARDITP